MPSCPIAMPSSTAMVLNSLATPTAASISRATSCPRSLRCTCPGTNWVNELTTAMIGLPKSPSFIPVARHRLRAPAMLRPWVVVRVRYCGIVGFLHVRKRSGAGGRVRPSGRGDAGGTVLQHLHLLDRHKPARHHFVKHRQEGVDPVLTVDDLDHHRQVLRQTQELGSVEAARMTEADRAAQHGRAREVQLACLQHDRFIEREVAEPVVLTKKDSQQCGVAGKRHGSSPCGYSPAELGLPYCSTCTFSRVTSPLGIIPSSTGRKASILSLASTISITTGRFSDMSRSLVVCSSLE